MFTKNLAFYILIPAFILAGCSSTKNSAVKPVNTKSQKHQVNLSEEERINLQFLFVNANKEKLTGNLEQAAELFAQCIRIDGTNHASMFELAKIYYDSKQLNDALFFAESAYSIDPSNVWYRLLYAELLMNTKKYDEGEKIYEGLFKEYPSNVEYGFKYASALLYNGKISEAIKVYDTIEAEIGVNSELIIEKERLWLRLGKIDKAAAEIEKLIQKNPSDIKSYSLLVELYQVNEMPEKAYETIERMRVVNPNSPYLYLALAEYYRSTNQNEKSFEQLKLAFGSNELEHDIKLKIITSYISVAQSDPKMLEQATELSSILASTHPNDAISLAIYGDFLMMGENYTDAMVQYMASTAIDKNNLIVWQQLLICQSQLNDTKGMLKSSEEALSLFPNQSVLYLFKGVALTLDEQIEEATKTLLAGSKMVVDNDTQLKEFYVRLADNYNTLKQHEESDAYYEKALTIDPRDPLVLNNYSYYLSLRNVNLEKAEAMSRLSNEIQPDMSSYQDTYGWILFMQQKYSEAKGWLQKALDNGGAQNGTILEHMGDVYFHLNEIEKAIEYWQKAKNAGDASELIDKKISDQKYYE